MLGGREAPPSTLTSNVYALDINKKFVQFFYRSIHTIWTQRHKYFSFYLPRLRILWGKASKLHVLHRKQLVFTGSQKSSWESRNTFCWSLTHSPVTARNCIKILCLNPNLYNHTWTEWKIVFPPDFILSNAFYFISRVRQHHWIIPLWSFLFLKL